MLTSTRLTTEEFLEITKNLEGNYELEDGKLIEMPEEKQLNCLIIRLLMRLLEQRFKAHQMDNGGTEIEIHPGLVRRPDLCIFSLQVAVELLRANRSLFMLAMPAPWIVAEVVSPGKLNEVRDYELKPRNYAERGIQEHWIIDPNQHDAHILILNSEGVYQQADASLLAAEITTTVLCSLIDEVLDLMT